MFCFGVFFTYFSGRNTPTANYLLDYHLILGAQSGQEKSNQLTKAEDINLFSCREAICSYLLLWKQHTLASFRPLLSRKIGF